MKILFFLSFLVAGQWANLFCQNMPVSATPIPKRQYFTKTVPSGSIKLDGKLDDEAWQTVDWAGDFVEYQPDENTPPYQKTQFRIVFDEKHLYIGARCFDSAPDSLVKRMSRRDEFPGDWIEINIDSYHDLRTAFSFTFSVSGVRGDEFISDNGNNWDANWNPIWDGRSAIDSLGWTAEIKIPFSQLRYGNQTEPVWGFQVQRNCFRKGERSVYQYIPRNSGGWVSFFAELYGLRNLPLNKGVEIAPYFLAKTEHFEAQEGNPFADGSRQQLAAGVDGKLAVTRDLILDFTINPDFGQVEADPGAVRLDGYQVFFSERRPFFMESRNLFDYRLTGSEAGGDYDSDLLFYSRRIGGKPHGYPQLTSDEFANVPQATHILAAAKFSGKTKRGWSMGILESVTQREFAKIDRAGERRKELVEPLTNYFVGRLMKDFRQGNTVVGAVLTAVNREKDFENLHRSAYSGGLDFQHFWKNRQWFVRGNAIFSRVAGTPDAILNTQTSFTHHFQRSNARHLEVDARRTSLTGTGGTVRFGRIAGIPDKIGGVFKFETGGTWRSPELELNDIGFLQAADEINHFAWAGYHIQKPFGIFNSVRLNYNHFARWDFGGQHLFTMISPNAHAFFKNFWGIGSGFHWNPLDISNNALRGGSSLRRPSGWGNWAYLESDDRKNISFFANTFIGRGHEKTVRVNEITFGANFQIMDALRVGVYPNMSKSWRKQDQFVQSVRWKSAERTIVSEVEQQSFAIITRINYNLNPNLTLQFYGQPFIFRALYRNFGYVADPLNKNYESRFHVFSDQQLSSDAHNNFQVDENSDGVVDYSFSKPDFNYIQFRSNLVLRWEYIPGSEFFLVWSQGATPNAFGDLQTPIVRSLFENVFAEKPTNIFLMKLTYRFVK